MTGSATVIRYGIIGVINTLIGYGVLFYLTYIGVLAELSNLFGYAVGFVVSYFLNKKYNFKSKNSHSRDLPKFFFSMAIAYVLNLFALMFSYRFFGIDVYVSQILASVVYTLSGYFLSKFWVFKEVASAPDNK